MGETKPRQAYSDPHFDLFIQRVAESAFRHYLKCLGRVLRDAQENAEWGSKEGPEGAFG